MEKMIVVQVSADVARAACSASEYLGIDVDSTLIAQAKDQINGDLERDILEWHKINQNRDGTFSGMPTEEGRLVLIRGKGGWYHISEVAYDENFVDDETVDGETSGWFFDDIDDLSDVDAWSFLPERE